MLPKSPYKYKGKEYNLLYFSPNIKAHSEMKKKMKGLKGYKDYQYITLEGYMKVKGDMTMFAIATYAHKKSKGKKQGYNARLDESLGSRRGAKSTKKQSYKSRRDESKGMEKSMSRRAYASVKTMDKKNRKTTRR